jgi:nitrate reductase NapE component
MSRKNRKAKPASRLTRRKKQSKLFAAIVIELIAAVALFGAYRFAQDVRASQQSQQTQPASVFSQSAQDPQSQLVQSKPVGNRFTHVSESVDGINTSDQEPVFRLSRLIQFEPEGS